MFASFSLNYFFLSSSIGSPHQAVPLDFDTHCFYEHRKPEIDKRLSEICEWSMEQLIEFVDERWQNSNKITACPAKFDLFRDFGK